MSIERRTFPFLQRKNHTIRQIQTSPGLQDLETTPAIILDVVVLKDVF